ncbi:trypsin-like serine protease [bacterium]|nr:trypsin-like serine protease [bacterium]
MRIVLPVLLLTFCCAANAPAIVIRHDREDARYRALADGHPEVGRIGAGMGTLVAPCWVVTAGHVAEQVLGGGEVVFGERAVPVARVFIHPDYAVEGRHRDLALVELAAPVADIAPARLYGRDDETGRQILFVGDGQTGDGRTGPAPGPRIRRGAHNVVTDATPGWLHFAFDAPPQGADLEGISGPGDSGGPALLRRDDALWVLGVSAYNDGGALCTYGTNEHYARVSDERAWLDGVMAGTVTTTSERRLLRHEVDADGNDTVASEEIRDVPLSPADGERAAAVTRALIAALNAADGTAFGRPFSAAYLEREGAAGLAGMLEFVSGSRAVHGDIVSLHPVGATALAVGSAGRVMIPVVWHMADGMGGYFGLVLDGAGRIDEFSLFVRRGVCRAGGECEEAVPIAE